MIQTDADPYNSSRGAEMQAAQLNFGPYASSTNPDIYSFSGNAYSLNLKAKQMRVEELAKYRSLRINVTGTMTKTNDMCCFWNTIVWGSIFIVPLFFICCDWWKRKVNKQFTVWQSGYEGVSIIIQSSRAEEAYVMVQDNKFNQTKAEILRNSLRKSSVRNFVFNNVAIGFNTQNYNYSNFDVYMKSFKQLQINSDICWGAKFVS